MNFVPGSAVSLRVFAFLACLPSGGALLLMVWGILTLQDAVLYLAVPGTAALVVLWLLHRKRRDSTLADALVVGFWGGLLGTLAYDAARVPFRMLGQRIFAPISSYGVWILESPHSSPITEVAGWLYHFSNGVTFGIMYALFMKDRHWTWAVAWACLLETIVLLSPFRNIFEMSARPGAIAIAYLGHVAYGLPLGWLVRNWNSTRHRLGTMPMLLRVGLGCAALLLVVTPVLGNSPPIVAGRFDVVGTRLLPDWQRISRGESVFVRNEGDSSVTVRIRKLAQSVKIGPGSTRSLEFSRTGLYQLFVETAGMTRSSFVIVEPVWELE